MVEVRDLFPDLIREEFGGIERINEALKSSEENYAERIEDLIRNGKIQPGQVDIWRSVPTLRFGPIPSTVEVTLEFGKTLYSTVDSRGNSRHKPEPVVTCDLYCAFQVPDWSIYLRDGTGTSFPEHPLTEPKEALAIRARKARATHLFGNIYPKGCALGEVAFDMARLADAVEACATSRYDFDAIVLPMIVTDDPEIYKTFKSQFSILFLTDEDKESRWCCAELDREVSLGAG